MRFIFAVIPHCGILRSHRSTSGSFREQVCLDLLDGGWSQPLEKEFYDGEIVEIPKPSALGDVRDGNSILVRGIRSN